MQRLKITLVNLVQGNGSAGLVESGSKSVWAEVSDVGVTTKFAAMSAGKEAVLQAVIWRSEYGGHTHADVGGTRYKISETGAADNPLRLKLILARGG